MTGRAMAARSDETGTGSAEGNSAVANGDGPQITGDFPMVDTTDQQAVTVAQIEAARRYIRGEDDAIAWAIQAAIDASPDRRASVSSASAEPRKDTVAFVQDWLMNSDYDPTQFDKGFAAAIDARHGFDDAALTAIAERFCAAPLPDTVCADLVAIKPMAGRSGTNLMTVAEAKAVLRSIFPEPVPATNQAGEVERLREALQIVRGSCGDLRNGFARYVEPSRWVEQIVAHIDAALTTQPATSQEGEALPTDQYGETVLDRMRDHAENGVMQPQFREDLRALLTLAAATPSTAAKSQEGEDKGNHDCLAKRRPNEPMFILLGRDPDAWQIVQAWAQRRLNAGGDPEHVALGMKTANAMREYAADPANRPASAPAADAYPTLAATPTPPTLSEDLREAIEQAVSVLERLPYGDWPGPMYSGKTVAANALIRRLRAALAQVKAS